MGENGSKKLKTTAATDTKALTCQQEVALRDEYANLRQSTHIATIRIEFLID